MARRARIILPGVPLHVIQRGNNRQRCFFSDRDRRFYLDCLGDAAEASRCAIHAYVLMSNHVHLLLTPATAESAGLLMKRLSQRYVQYVNRNRHRSGTLWEGRFRSCVVQEEAYLLNCYRYIELNPVRAGLVVRSDDYVWSSHRANARGTANGLLTAHQTYLALGQDEKARQGAYRALFRQALRPAFIDDVRSATNGNFVLGDRPFHQRVAAALGRRVTPGGTGGRPRRQAE